VVAHREDPSFISATRELREMLEPHG
jgi:hypothetical protein